ncbi:MAG: M28 family peptidase [Phaeodactylibacter sp.]|nr:M28 family peptidase [Phaeodactylibacter sp.]
MALKTLFAYILALFICCSLSAQPAVLPDSLLAHVRILSSDEYQGRRTQEKGNLMAGDYLVQRYRSMGLKAFGDSYVRPFSFYNRWMKQAFNGRNIVGYVRGSAFPGQYIVLSAHYDHLGVKNDRVYNGADDNASGVGALIELARYFSRRPPLHSIIFAAFDAEEMGLKGAQSFLDEPPVPLDNILFNINMDMISRNEKNELYICGAKHYPFLRAPLENPARESRLAIAFGHDEPTATPQDDWTTASDHGCFHKKGIPFLYFGVEDHADYHKPTDDYERIMPAFYTAAADFILNCLLVLDKDWSGIRTGKGK